MNGTLHSSCFNEFVQILYKNSIKISAFEILCLFLSGLPVLCVFEVFQNGFDA